MTETVLNASLAVEVLACVAHNFVKLRQLARWLNDPEQKSEAALILSHGTFSRNTIIQLKRVLDSRRELKMPPDPQVADRDGHARRQG